MYSKSVTISAAGLHLALALSAVAQVAASGGLEGNKLNRQDASTSRSEGPEQSGVRNGPSDSERGQFTGNSAGAVWEDGLQLVSISLSTQMETIGDVTFEASTLEVFVVNEAFPFGLMGFAELSPDQFTISADHATVTAEVVLLGSPPLEVVVTVAASWDAEGRVFPSVFQSHSLFPDGFSFFAGHSLARLSTATGMISGELSLDLGEASFATVSRDRLMFRASSDAVPPPPLMDGAGGRFVTQEQATAPSADESHLP